MARPKIKVICGANSQELEVVGKNVKQVKEVAKDILNLPDNVQALVSGNNIENTYVIREGDVLEFVKPGGRKT